MECRRSTRGERRAVLGQELEEAGTPTRDAQRVDEGPVALVEAWVAEVGRGEDQHFSQRESSRVGRGTVIVADVEPGTIRGSAFRAQDSHDSCT